MTALSRLSSQLTELFHKPEGCPANVGQSERLASIVGGSALVLTGVSRRSLPGALLALAGGLLIYRGTSGIAISTTRWGSIHAGGRNTACRATRGSR